ncbi:Kinesin-like protein KIF6 [Bagarius yarrelli]|uniref:Kinesin-like protein n=1 Tax=Bagarius yarrelli TaxID=175774 RepID=A0A556U558_BAGYA|nr:Kinesin-like protein KIF6 [Bagarius yarrelli]
MHTTGGSGGLLPVPLNIISKDINLQLPAHLLDFERESSKQSTAAEFSDGAMEAEEGRIRENVNGYWKVNMSKKIPEDSSSDEGPGSVVLNDGFDDSPDLKSNSEEGPHTALKKKKRGIKTGKKDQGNKGFQCVCSGAAYLEPIYNRTLFHLQSTLTGQQRLEDPDRDPMQTCCIDCTMVLIIARPQRSCANSIHAAVLQQFSITVNEPNRQKLGTEAKREGSGLFTHTEKVFIGQRVEEVLIHAGLITVYCVDNEEQRGGSLEFVIPRDLTDGFINNKRESYRFRFQKVFDQRAEQEEIFEAIAKPVANNVLAGYNGTIFAYGQTGSGKTFTITGGAERYSDRGIIPRTLSYLYQHITQDSSMVYTTHISYLEIYNEVGYDLLDPRHEANNLEDLPKVTIMEDPEQNIHLKNLSLQQSANEEEALNLLFLGDTNRMIAETPMNQASTRSHCIFTIHLCSREPGSATVRRSKLHLVDLAGSERVGKAGLGGQILTEAKYINLSLHYLEQVITALSEKNRSHIPYRNSMMTSVLRDSLGGNCMTTMIAMVSVEKRNVGESISTCRFAQRVAMIKNEALLNEELDPSLIIIRLKKEIQCLKEELALLTGEQKGNELTQEEIQSGNLDRAHQCLCLEQSVLSVVFDSSGFVQATEDYCLKDLHAVVYQQLIFARLREKPMEVRIENGAQNEAGDFNPLSSSSITDRSGSPANEQLLKLKEMLTQRDNEISILYSGILVSLLKKEKRKVQEANGQLAKFGDFQRSLQSSFPGTDTVRRKDQEVSEDTMHMEHVKCKRNGTELSMGRQEAFEVFRSEHEDNITIEDNKVILKQRVAEAKELGKQINQARSKVNELKKRLETRRMQLAAQDVMGNQPRTESDPVEERLRIQIEEEKKIYKNTFERLKALKTEIEHLEFLHQRAKIKLQKDFQDCLRHDHHITNQDIAQTYQPPPPTPELRALSFAGPVSASIPLTGEQQTDADILAFIKARQNLLSKSGISFTH